MLRIIIKVRVLDQAILKDHFNRASHNYITLCPTQALHTHCITKWRNIYSLLEWDHKQPSVGPLTIFFLPMSKNVFYIFSGCKSKKRKEEENFVTLQKYMKFKIQCQYIMLQCGTTTSIHLPNVYGCFGDHTGRAQQM